MFELTVTLGGDVFVGRGGVAGAARAEGEMPVLFFFILELAQVVEKGSEDSPSLKSLQQGD